MRRIALLVALLGLVACNETLGIEEPSEARSDLSIVVNVTSAIAGGPLTYHVSVINSGPTGAIDVQVSHTLPDNAVFNSVRGDGWMCTELLGRVTCTRVLLATGGADIVIDAVAPVEGETATARTTVWSPAADDDISNNVVTSTTIISASADLSIAVADAPDPVDAGGLITYTIDVANQGPSTATDVVVNLQATPSGVTFLSAMGMDWSCSFTAASVTCDRSSLRVGLAAPITVTGRVPSMAGSIQLHGTVAANSIDPVLANNESSESTTVVAIADLSLSMTDSPDPVAIGNQVMYSLVVQNAGPTPASAVSVSDPLPAGTMFVSAGGTGWSCAVANQIVTFTRPSLQIGTAPTIQVNLTAPSSSGTFTNAASVTAGSPDPVSSNNSASTTTTVSPSADLSIAVTDAPDPVLTSGTVTYTVNVENLGPATATTVAVSNALPTGTTFSSASGTGWVCSASGQVVTCTRASLSIGAAPAISIAATVPASAAVLTNNASVTATTADQFSFNNTASTVTMVVPPMASADLSVALSASPDPVTAGGVLTYSAVVTNIGPDSASGISLSGQVPIGTTFANASGTGWTCSVAAGVLTCTRPSLSVAAAPAITVNVYAPPTSGSVLNILQLSSSTGDPNSANNSASTSTMVTTCTVVASGTFGAATTYTTGNDPHAVEIGDLNADGKADIVVANINDSFANQSSPGSISVFINNGNGTFATPVSYPAGLGSNSIAIGDLDGDLIPDLAVTAYNSHAVLIFRGNGNGTFQPAVAYTTFANPRVAAIGDLNRDGKPDLVVAISNVGKVLVLRGNGDGTFQSSVGYDVASDAYTVAIADLNFDNKLDVVAASFPNTGSVSVLMGNGDATLDPSVEYAAGDNPISIIIRDFDGDGARDIIAANYGTSNVSVLIGNGNGPFKAPINYGVGSAPFMVETGDLNGDGKLDLVVVNHSSDNVSVLRGNGDGTFQAATSYSVGTNPRAIALADVSGDCIPDFVTANFGADTATVRLGQP